MRFRQIMAVGSLAVGVLLWQGDPAPAVGAGAEDCSDHDLELPSGRVSGTLCVPAGGSPTVIVSIAGGTYGRAYWDLPYERDTYSFVKNMVRRGYAVFNIDRLGIGASDHPPSATVTVHEGARSVHEIVQATRAGELGEMFTRVVLAGHSVGST